MACLFTCLLDLIWLFILQGTACRFQAHVMCITQWNACFCIVAVVDFYVCSENGSVKYTSQTCKVDQQRSDDCTEFCCDWVQHILGELMLIKSLLFFTKHIDYRLSIDYLIVSLSIVWLSLPHVCNFKLSWLKCNPNGITRGQWMQFTHLAMGWTVKRKNVARKLHPILFTNACPHYAFYTVAGAKA